MPRTRRAAARDRVAHGTLVPWKCSHPSRGLEGDGVPHPSPCLGAPTGKREVRGAHGSRAATSPGVELEGQAEAVSNPATETRSAPAPPLKLSLPLGAARGRQALAL